MLIATGVREAGDRIVAVEVADTESEATISTTSGGEVSRGVQSVTSDDHEGLKATISRQG